VAALRFLLDTNVVSELVKPAPNPEVQRAYAHHLNVSALSAVTVEELLFGCLRLPAGARRAKLQQWLEATFRQHPALAFDRRAALWLGLQRARLAALGRVVPYADAQIAAIAASQGLTLVTRNTPDFLGFEGLHLANWHGEGLQ
jgi:tRNA(fMet)-specific endonuclease VapC